MNTFAICLAALSLLSAVASVTVECIENEIKELVRTTEQSTCSVNEFHHRPGHSLHSFAHDIRPLTHIYKSEIGLDDQLDTLIDEIQCSCDFSRPDSEELSLTLAAASEPIIKSLEAFESKRCDFENALGPALTHRVVGGGLKRTRCLTLDMSHSIECKIDNAYKEVVSAAQSDIDSAFQKVSRLY